MKKLEPNEIGYYGKSIESLTEVSEINRDNFPEPAIDRASALYDL